MQQSCVAHHLPRSGPDSRPEPDGSAHESNYFRRPLSHVGFLAFRYFRTSRCVRHADAALRRHRVRPGLPLERALHQRRLAGLRVLRDVKCHFSEAHGAKYSGIFATPWLASTIELLTALRDSTTTTTESDRKPSSNNLPLRIGFTHRAEILYLCALLNLGLGSRRSSPWTPDLTRIDHARSWRVSQMAPYVEHVGIETFLSYDEISEADGRACGSL